MTTISHTVIAPLPLDGETAALPLTRINAAGTTPSASAAFNAAMERAQAQAQADPVVAPQTLAQTAPTAPANPAAPASAAQPGTSAPSPTAPDTADQALDRARGALGFDSAASPTTRGATTGDTIIGGLQQLRTVFDNQNARLNSVMSQPVVDANALLSMQVEVVKYTLLIDVTSKLTGKSTQSFDTLMKGQ